MVFNVAFLCTFSSCMYSSHSVHQERWSQDWGHQGRSSVEADGVQEGTAALLLELLQQLVDLILHVLRVLDLQRVQL